jgi:hypothetical protein
MIDQTPVFLLKLLNKIHLAREGNCAECWLGWAEGTAPVYGLMTIHRFSQLLRASPAFGLEVKKKSIFKCEAQE